MPQSSLSLRLSRRTALAGAAAAIALPAAAQPAWPARPVRLIVPFAPGGGHDTFSRLIAQGLQESLGQTILVENRPGSGGVIAAAAVAAAPPDGYTLLTADIGANAIAAALYDNLPYDAATAFAPVSLSVRLTSVLIVPASLPVTTLADLIQRARARPGQLNYASAGTGGISHLAVEMLKLATGTDIVHVPYRGGAPGAASVAAGDTQLMVTSVASAKPLVTAGRVRILAVTSARRSELLPETPTASEAGVPGFSVDAWAGIAAPAGVPRPIVERLGATIAELLGRPQIRARLAATGFEPIGSTPDEFADFLRSEIARWTGVIRAGNIRPD